MRDRQDAIACTLRHVVLLDCTSNSHRLLRDMVHPHMQLMTLSALLPLLLSFHLSNFDKTSNAPPDQP
jgi:hypothetical protein